MRSCSRSDRRAAGKPGRPSLARMGYAGDVSPEDAYAALAADDDAVLVDVRTTAEWSYVGLPDLSDLGKRVVCVEWQRFPDGAVNGCAGAV